jgi:hypothetical protein
LKHWSKRGFVDVGKEIVKGNSPENDVVPAYLSKGEIVVDKETIAKGMSAITGFIHDQLAKHHPHLVEEAKPSMAEGGKVDNSLSPENALNQHVPDKGIVGGTVYDGSSDELFLFGEYCFDIDKARAISGKKSNAEIPVSQKWIDKIKLDPKEAMKSSSKNPVFIAQVHTPNGIKPLLIDGNHRMYKALQQNKKVIAAYVFSPEQSSSLFAPKPEGVDHPKFGSINKNQNYNAGGMSEGFDGGGIVDTVMSYINPTDAQAKARAKAYGTLSGSSGPGHYSGGAVGYSDGDTVDPSHLADPHQGFLENLSRIFSHPIENILDPGKKSPNLPTGQNWNYNSMKAMQTGAGYWKGGAVGYSDGGTGGFDPDQFLAEVNGKAKFDPDKFLKEVSEKKENHDSSLGDKLQTGLESYGNALSLGYLPQIQAATSPIMAGVYNAVTGNNVKPDSYVQERDANISRQAEQSKENPISSKIGTGLGFINGAALAPEVNVFRGAGYLPAIARGAVTGGAYGAAQNPGDKPGEVSPVQIGDRAKNAAFGAGTGAALGFAFAPFSDKFIGNASANGVEAMAPGAADSVSSESASKAKANISGGDLSIETGGKPFSYNAPKNLDELNFWQPSSGAGELPGKGRLKEIEQILPDLQTKPLAYHYDMMDNPKSMKALKLQFENLPTDSAKKIAAYNQSMVDDAAQSVRTTIKNMTGEEPMGLSDSGHDFIAKVREKYENDREALGPVFEDLQKSAPLSEAEAKDLAINISQNSKIGKLTSVDPNTGEVLVAKNSPRSGMSDDEHAAISRVLSDLNSGGMSFQDIQNSREFLRKMVDPANPNATPEINKVRSLMLGQLENMAESRNPNAGKAFRDYAINERSRENVEKIIGGKISDLDRMYAANPDKVVGKIFSNPNYSKIVGEYVGPEKMKEMAQSYVADGLRNSFDSAKGFLPSTMKSWLGQAKNKAILNANVDPEVVERLGAAADYGYYGKRFLDEVNPSGTAASLKEALEPGNFFSSVKQKGFVGALEASASDKIQKVTQQNSAVKNFNKALGTDDPSFMDKVRDVVGGQPSNVAQKAATLSTTNNYKSAGGYQKWYADGLKNLSDHADNDQDRALIDKMKSKLVSDPKGQRLLLEASTLKPGSKKMKQVLLDIKGMQ